MKHHHSVPGPTNDVVVVILQHPPRSPCTPYNHNSISPNSHRSSAAPSSRKNSQFKPCWRNQVKIHECSRSTFSSFQLNIGFASLYIYIYIYMFIAKVVSRVPRSFIMERLPKGVAEDWSRFFYLEAAILSFRETFANFISISCVSTMPLIKTQPVPDRFSYFTSP